MKPHASPVYHAIKYLTGELDRTYLTSLRQLGGLQAYPSRTKDPDVADFSTGSVGLGAVRRCSRHSLAGTSNPTSAADRALGSSPGRRRRTRRGKRVGSHRRSRHAGPRQLHDGDRPQPPKPRPHHSRYRGASDETVLRGRRLARGRAKYGSRLTECIRTTRRRRAPRPHRRDAQRGLSGAVRARRSRCPQEVPGARRSGCRPIRRRLDDDRSKRGDRPRGARPRPACSRRSTNATPNQIARVLSLPTRSKAGGFQSPATRSTTRPCSRTTRSMNSDSDGPRRIE